MERARRGEDGGRGGVSIGEWGGRVVDGRIVRNIMNFDLIFAISLHHYDMPYSQAASPNYKQAR